MLSCPSLDGFKNQTEIVNGEFPVGNPAAGKETAAVPRVIETDGIPLYVPNSIPEDLNVKACPVAAVVVPESNGA